MNFCKLRYFTYRMYGSQNTDSLPVITIPSYLKKKVRILRAKQEYERLEEVRGRSRQGNRHIPIITSDQKPELNHYLHRVYDPRRELPLITLGWRRGAYKGHSFTIHKHADNPCVVDPDDASFSSLGLDSRIIRVLEKQGFKTPSVIQERTIPVLLSRVSAVCCAETGSGKTLAYAAPLVQLLMRGKVAERNTERPPMSPLAIVLLPSKELVLQIGEVVTNFTEECGLSTCILAPGFGFQKNLSKVKKNQGAVDIVVATAGSLHTLVANGVMRMSYVDHVVVDEADTLVDNSFIDIMGHIMKDISIKENCDLEPSTLDEEFEGQNIGQMGSQLILVGATVPKNLDNSFGHLIDLESLTWVTTSSLHHLPPHITHIFKRIGKEEKAVELVKVASRELLQKRPLMVFSNRTTTAVWASSYLSRHNIPNVSFHKGLTNKERKENLSAFQEGHVDVISCTDLASRGLNTLRVKTILNLEFPKYMSDYIHRAGRTGRLGAPTPGGQVINFISSKWEIPLLQQIETAARRVTKLPGVDANIKKQYEEYAAMKENRLALTQ